MMEKARSVCLRACLASAVDIAALGPATLTKSAAPISQFLATASLMHLVTKIPQIESEFIAPAIAGALKHEKVRKMVDGMLTAIRPPQPQTQPAPA
jgi:hypothetical protein